MAEFSQNRERARPFGQNRRYFLSGTPVGSAKVRLSILFLVLSLGWVAVAASSKERRDRATNHGPIHQSHAAWIDQCDACHVPFTGEKAGIFDTKDRWNTFRCETCHSGHEGALKVYAPHMPSKTKPEDTKSADCAFCHKDHQGADFALSKPADSACTQCHSDLQNFHSDVEKMKVANSIRDFANKDGGHPVFQSLEKPIDKIRSLKFSHAVHMTPGLTTKLKLEDIPSDPNLEFLQPPDGLQPLKLKDLAPKAQKQSRYGRFAGSDGTITLECSACHELQPSGLSPLSPARTSGEVYQPISHEKHCASCHDLTIGAKATIAGAGLKPFSVTHKSPFREALTDEIRRNFLGQLAEARPGTVQWNNQGTKRLDPLPSKEPLIKVEASVQQEVDRLTKIATEELFKEPFSSKSGNYVGARYCMKCHLPPQDEKKQDTKAKDEPESTPDAKKSKDQLVKKTDLHPVWLKAARFDHSKHRAMDCKGCHEQKYGILTGNLLASDELEKPGIPGIDNCRQCHAPAGKTAEGKPVGGVRHACVDCHSYHNGEYPTHGPGSPFRDPPASRRLTIQDLLRGTPKDTPR